MKLVFTHFVALLAASVLGYLGMAALTFLFSDGPNTTVADFVSGIGFLALGYFYGYGAWRGSESADVHKIQQLQSALGMEMGMRTAAIDQLETLRRHLWALVDGDQLCDDETVERLRAALTTAENDHG